MEPKYHTNKLIYKTATNLRDIENIFIIPKGGWWWRRGKLKDWIVTQKYYIQSR